MAEKSEKIIVGDLTIVGNITGEPELRFTPSGAAVVNFTVAENHRKFNKETNQWEDNGASFYRCSLWRDAAENFAESGKRGDRVIVRGRVTAESYTPNEGPARVSLNLDVDEVGLSSKFATVKATKAERGNNNAGNNGNGFAGNAPAAADDPWATGATPAMAGAPTQAPGYDEPPF